MTMVEIPGASPPLQACLARPEGAGPWPGVVVLHDALGMSHDLRAQTKWLAGAGYLAAGPDLYRGKAGLRCMIAVARAVTRGEGQAFLDVEATRAWLATREDCTKKIAVLGFCLGGGFALALAPRSHGFSASSVNYGGLMEEAETQLKTACPIVASYGAKDKGLRGSAARLEGILSEAGVAHDVHEYPDAGHAFLNDHDLREVPAIFRFMSWATGGSGYHGPSAEDARRRILAFFAAHLRDE
ncbi:dienelactone hydrolase family protein [Pseudenhygromyxa sp. WMMC2535]|uniref:dienelactone hydrolase family protein n=1 Tax=Pseudenhygromyxa sp. WMMC2535 TaxID=2712867 RepID=UPI0015579CFA|nr:dienelactone hydrolase family protein [Pseudenhygromyxa sp. WMMC2535]NVB42556.1 dienelactone hydrolase family protein [Pseudenhygromyxa sp. WMMC2535]